MYRLITDLDEKTYDEFVLNHTYSNLLQSSGWAHVKANWDHIYLGFEKKGRIVGAAMVLIKHLPLRFKAMYIPRGPIVDYDNIDLTLAFIKAITIWAKKEHAVIVKFDPNVSLAEYHLNEERKENELGRTIVETFQQAGFEYRGETRSMKDTVQPRFQVEVHADDIENIMHVRHLKKMLAIADKKKVEIEIAHLEKLSVFAGLMKKTESRKHVALRDEEYFRRILETYGDHAFLVFGKISIKKQFDKICQELEHLTKELEACENSAPKKYFLLNEKRESLLREYAELEPLVKEQEEVYICGVLAVVYGLNSEILYAGMDERFKRYMGPYKVWIEAMKYCFKQGAKTCNLGGVDGNLSDNLLQFKANFYPVINERIGEFDALQYPRSYHFGKLCFRLFKTIKKRKK